MGSLGSEHLFSLNAEGGPLLCLDAAASSCWRGAEDGAADYGNLCAEIDARPDFSAAILPLPGGPGVVWEMAGAGTADVFLRPDGSLIAMRAWLSEESAEELDRLVGAAASSRQELGDLAVPSGAIAVLWAPESGKSVPQGIGGLWQTVPGTALDESAFVVKAPYGHYSCLDEFVQVGEASARRLTLVPRR